MGRQAHKIDSATNAGEIADIPDLDGDGPHEDEEKIAQGLRWSRSSWQDAYSIHWCLGSDMGVRGSVTCVDTLLHCVCTIPVFTTTSLCVYVRTASARPSPAVHVIG